MKKTLFSAKRFVCAAIAALMILGVCGASVLASSAPQLNTRGGNRFNVVIVLDASGSMNYTDPNSFRHSAITQFVNLLAQEGNVVGGVVFGTQIEATMEPRLFTTQADKDELLNLFQSVTPDNTKDTNIGLALQTAVEMLRTHGDPNLEDVILFLSDGKTDLTPESLLNESLGQKADAIQDARDNNIRIFTVCLNSNGRADPQEMAQIAQATGGETREVASAEDLENVFQAFYNLIYGTSTIPLVDREFPPDGIIETEFTIPGIGVEEVNIIITGETTSISVLNTDHQVVLPAIQNYGTFSTVKITEFEPGVWTLITEGNPGRHIKVNMVYNSALVVDVEHQPAGMDIPTEGNDTELTVRAVLRAGETVATTPEQYSGFEASLKILNGYGDEIASIPMTLNGDHFEASHTLPEGAYFFYVDSWCDYVSASSEHVGPIRVYHQEPTPTDQPQPTPPPNTAPTPVDDEINKTIYLIPFKKNVYSVDMTTLATDAEDSVLRYRIESSSFILGTDYRVDGDVLTIDHYSLGKGAFTISATDSGGLSCNIEIRIKTISVSLIALIALGVGALAVVGAVVWVIIHRPTFKGTISVDNYANSYGMPKTHASFKGKLKLQYFGVGNCGLDQAKCYFMAKSKSSVFFHSYKPVYSATSMEPKKDINLFLGDNVIFADENQTQGIKITLDAQLY